MSESLSPSWPLIPLPKVSPPVGTREYDTSRARVEKAVKGLRGSFTAGDVEALLRGEGHVYPSVLFHLIGLKHRGVLSESPKGTFRKRGKT